MADAPADIIAMPLGGRRMLQVQRFGDVVRLSSGFVVDGATSPAMQLIGSMTIPLAKIDDLLAAIRKAARKAKR